MSQSGEDVTIFEATDGILLFGPDTALAIFDKEVAGGSKKISQKDVARIAGHAGMAVGKLQADSGRWLKLTSESAEHLSKFRGTSIGKDKLLPGVLRGDKGKFVKQLKFQDLSKASFFTPAAPMVLGAMATKYALEASLDEISAYLEVIDQKLDQLIQQKKTETLGQIGGVALAIGEANAILTKTGRVSPVTWSKVQATSLSLQTMQAEAIAALYALSDSIAAVQGNTDNVAKELRRAKEDTQFWLGVLARTIALQDRQYLLELARIEDENELQLDAHREGISVARTERVRRIAAGLDSFSQAVIRASQLTNAAKVANPINAPKVARLANTISEMITTFKEHADLELQKTSLISQTPWRRAARGLIGEASSAVGSAGAGVAERARTVSHAVGERRDLKVLRKAEKIEEKRRLRD